MARTPSGSLFGTALSSAASPAGSTFEGLMRGLGGLGPAIEAAKGMATAAESRRAARSVANYKRAEALKGLAADLTYGGDRGGALGQVLGLKQGAAQSYPGRSRGRGGAQQTAAPRFPLHEAEGRAATLDDIARAVEQRQRMPSALQQIQMMTPGGQVVPEGEQGLRNVAAERLGLSSRQIVKPETLFQLAELVRSGDPTMGPLLSGLGLPEDLDYKDLMGLGAKAREFESRLAGQIAKSEAEGATLDLASRNLMMRERLRHMQYDGNNIEELAKEIARMDDESAEAIMTEIGRPGKFAFLLKKAGIDANKITKVFTHHSGLGSRNRATTSIRNTEILGRAGFKSEEHLLREIKQQSYEINRLERPYDPKKGKKVRDGIPEDIFIAPPMSEERIERLRVAKARLDYLQGIADELRGFELEPSGDGGGGGGNEVTREQEKEWSIRFMGKKLGQTPLGGVLGGNLRENNDASVVNDVRVLNNGKILELHTEAGFSYRVTIPK